MGGANTKPDDAPPPVSGVQVTEGLIRQLDGQPASQPQTVSSRPAGPPWTPHRRPALSSHAPENTSTTDIQEDVEAPSSPYQENQPVKAGRESAAGQHEQEHKKETGVSAETKPEAVSQQKVNQYADQLVQKYEASLKALPCQEEKTNCLLCYQHNQQDPLQCAAEVAAFTRCARKASAIIVK